LLYMINDAFARGYDHIKEKSPREDFGETKTTDSCRIFTVADGHGDSNCPRSSFGSEIACHTAIVALERFSKDIAENGLEDEVIRLGSQGPTSQERIDKKDRVRQLIAHIVYEWRNAVNAEFSANPLTPSEREKCDRYLERYERGEKVEHIYGTTLIAGLLTEKYLLLLQQGDGRCDVFGSNGEVSQPIPWDDRCFANVTTSLCEEDAVQRFRYCVIDVAKNPVIACIADSDGVEDSFASMELLHCYHRDILIYACENGMSALHKYLRDTLPEMSENYSRDDITISGFLDLEKLQSHIPAFKRANERVRIESRLSDIEGRLKSFDSMGKLAGLKAQAEKATAEVTRIETELAEVQDGLEAVNSNLRCIHSNSQAYIENLKRINPQLWEQEIALPKEIDSLRAKLQKAQEDKEKKERAYYEYQSKKDFLLKEREEIQAELSRLDAEPIADSCDSHATSAAPVESTIEQTINTSVIPQSTLEEKPMPRPLSSDVTDTVVPMQNDITDDLAAKQETLHRSDETFLQADCEIKSTDVSRANTGGHIEGRMPSYQEQHSCAEQDCSPQIQQHTKKKCLLGRGKGRAKD